MQSYRQVLSVPGMPSLLAVAFLVRLPSAASSIALSLYVVSDLHRGYSAAGIAAAAMAAGTAFGAPRLGRMIDRRGLRHVLVITTCAEAVFWFVCPSLPFWALLGFAVATKTMSIPTYAIIRQSIAVRVPERHRRTAYAMDSIMVEMTYMIGPALAVVLATQLSATLALYLVGAASVAGGTMLFVANPLAGAHRTGTEPAPAAPGTAGHPAATPRAGEHPAAASLDTADSPAPATPDAGRYAKGPFWRQPTLLAQLALAAAATICLSGTDISIVASLREVGQTEWAGLVVTMWCVASATGGLMFGSLTRPVSPYLLCCLLGLTTIPVGIATGWHWLSLALLPTGLLCAPTLASSADRVSRYAPESQGEIIGLHGAALTIGTTIGAPFAGAVVDHSWPAMGFVVVGLVAAVISVAAATFDPVGAQGRYSVRRRRTIMP